MVRIFEQKDKEAIKKLFSILTGDEITDADLNNRLEYVERSSIDSLFVYELDGFVIGLMGFRIRENIESNSRYGEISLIVVDPKNQKQGIGKQLMKFAEQLAKDSDCIGTWLVSGFGREEKAHQFYRSMRYISTGFRFIKR